MATYTSEDVNLMKEGGNEKFLQKYLAKWNASAFPAPADKDAKKVDAFVRQVLVEKIFYDENVETKPAEVSRPQSAQGAESAGHVRPARNGQTSSVSEPSWQAFDGSSPPVPSPSVDPPHTGPSSDSWADFTPAPVVSGPSRQTTGGSYDVATAFTQRSPSIQSVGTRSEGVGMQNPAVSQTTPPAWNAFESDSFAQAPQANGTAVHTGGTSSSVVGSPSSGQASNRTKIPVMKELPEEMFSPPLSTLTGGSVASNPFGTFPAQPGGYMHPNMAPNPHPAAAFQQSYQAGMQTFAQNQALQHNMQQAGFQPGQPMPGYGQPHQMTSQGPMLGTSRHVSTGSFSHSPNPSNLVPGLSKDEGEADHTLFGNLIDIRSSIPRARPQRSGSFHPGTHLHVGSQPTVGPHSGSFAGTPQQQNTFGMPQQQSAFAAPAQQQSAFGMPAQQQSAFAMPAQQQTSFPGGPQHRQAPFMQGAAFSRSQSLQGSGYQNQGGQPYTGVQPAIVGQPQGSLQSGIQSSGNPFA